MPPVATRTITAQLPRTSKARRLKVGVLMAIALVPPVAAQGMVSLAPELEQVEVASAPTQNPPPENEKKSQNPDVAKRPRAPKTQPSVTPKGPGSAFRAEVPLHSYALPALADLLREARIPDAANLRSDLSLLEDYLTGKLSISKKREIQKLCAKTPWAERFLVQSTASLVCIVPALEERYFRQHIGVTEAREDSNVPNKVETPQHWMALANKDFSQSFRALKASDLAETMLHHKLFHSYASDCRLRNAAAALIAQAESWLPAPEAHEVIEDTYLKSARCLRPSEDGFERTHLRVGLLRLIKNELTGAKQALQQAVLAAEPKEEQRTLFWLGVLSQTRSPGTPEPRNNEYWQALMRRYPLEIHAILAAHSLGKDPLANLLGPETITLRRRSSTDQGEFSAVALLCEILAAQNSSQALRAWVLQAFRQYNPVTPQETLFLALYANRSELYLESIGLLSRYLREMGAGNVNLDFLDLFFPRPFAEQVLSHNGTIDPVLLFSLIRQESAFNPMARSQADARGLMQLVPSTAVRFQNVTPQDLYEPVTNIRLGVRLLEELMKRFAGKSELVLSSYNAGPAHISRWKNRFPIEQELLFSDLIPFKETRGYVANILRNAYWYGRLLTLQNNDIAKKTIERSNTALWRSTVVHSLLETTWKGALSRKEARAAVWDLFQLSKFMPLAEGTLPGRIVQEFPELETGGARENP